jgi:Glycosyl hydrolase family 12
MFGFVPEEPGQAEALAEQRELLSQLRAAAEVKDAEIAALRAGLEESRERERLLELQRAELERRLSMAADGEPLPASSGSGSQDSAQRPVVRFSRSDTPAGKKRTAKKSSPFLKRWRLRTQALVAVVAAMVAVGTYYAVASSGDPNPAALTTCHPKYTIGHSAVSSSDGGVYEVAPLDGGVYEMQTNEYYSNAPFSMCGNGAENFKIVNSQIDAPANGAPGGYPSIYRGCHWGDCTKDSGLPIQVSSMETNSSQVQLSYNTQVSARGSWDDAFDIFYTPCDDHDVSHSGCTQNAQPDREMMIWLSHHGPAIPGGKHTEVTLDGISFNLWWDGHHTMWYVIKSPSLANPHVQNLDLGDFIKDAVNRGYIPSPSWYLMDVEAGFEIWRGGQGLQVNSLSICTPSPVGCGNATRAAG